ncbi:hypothetical protein [Brazilian marseillevirus]|uniref:hypothetical protein n=1 Tax=Brazilian marseillevirus TaxID=1813599 RepID=UPI0007845465|nr:hypothetical protein A3303_gp324 [Brazilian marseillevirus]AMQ10832.1 hypothetical protein [Brazilian marseillevirus]
MSLERSKTIHKVVNNRIRNSRPPFKLSNVNAIAHKRNHCDFWVIQTNPTLSDCAQDKSRVLVVLFFIFDEKSCTFPGLSKKTVKFAKFFLSLPQNDGLSGSRLFQNLCDGLLSLCVFCEAFDDMRPYEISPLVESFAGSVPRDYLVDCKILHFLPDNGLVSEKRRKNFSETIYSVRSRGKANQSLWFEAKKSIAKNLCANLVTFIHDNSSKARKISLEV